MQEAWCRSWRQCVQTLPPHTRPLPPSGGAFGALLCRKEFLLNCSSHPRSLNDPEAQTLRCPGAASATSHGDGRARGRAGSGPEEQKTTADTWLGGSPDFLSPEKCSYCWCVCLFVSILWKFFIQTSFHLLGKERIDLRKLGNSALLLFSEGTPLDYCHRFCIPKEVWWEESEATTFSSGHRLPFHWTARKLL